MIANALQTPLRNRLGDSHGWAILFPSGSIVVILFKGRREFNCRQQLERNALPLVFRSKGNVLPYFIFYSECSHYKQLQILKAFNSIYLIYSPIHSLFISLFTFFMPEMYFRKCCVDIISVLEEIYNSAIQLK